jgi:subtilase-type serine protease
MNRVFKTKWSVAHQEYVVTDEKHASKTKAAKSVVALAVATLMLGAGAASAAYMEKGQVATSNADLEAAKQSWQSDEYKKDWGLEAMKASSAYALGYHGQGVKVAVMTPVLFSRSILSSRVIVLPARMSRVNMVPRATVILSPL